MAYTDPRVTYEYFDTTPAGTSAIGIQIEVEETLGICGRVGRHSDNGAAGTVPAGSVARDGVRCPGGALIEAFGLTITEALTNANATHCTLALKVLDKEGGTTTTVATITLPKDSTEVTPATQTNPVDRTATQAVAAGARLVSTASALPYKVAQGGIFYVEVTQAAGAAGGAFRPFVVARQEGNPAATAASPVTKIAS